MKKKDFDGIMQGLAEATAFVRGEDVPGIRVHIPAEINIKLIRGKLNMTQAAFANRYGFSAAAVRDWEQGRRVPDQGIRAYLKVIATEPALVEKILETA